MKKLLLFGAIALSLSSFGQVPNYVPTNGLVGYWPFNGNANDVSGNGHHGIVNGAVLAIDEDAISDEAYYFDGNDRITIPHHSDFNVQSLSILITYQDYQNLAAQPNGNSLLISKREQTGWGSSFEFNQGGASWDFAASNSISGNITYGFGSPQIYGQWRTVVYTHDADSIKVYFDGLLIDAISSPGVYNSNSLDITVGMRGNGWHELIGSISRLGIWNRVLTDCEIQDLNSKELNSISNVTQNGAILTAELSGANYQWLDCDNGNTQIVGETNQSFTPTITGNYAVEINSNGCIDTSACVLVDFTGLNDINKGAMKVYPNPTSETFSIEVDLNLVGSNYIIYNQLGAIVKKGLISNSNQIVDVSNLASGVYNLSIASTVLRTKLVKE